MRGNMEPYPFEPMTFIPLVDGDLGGTATRGDPDSVFPELWRWAAMRYEAKTVLDVGCGCGWAMKYFKQLGLEPFGIDGSKLVIEHHQLPDLVVEHDLRTGPWITQPFDLVWCCEVGEHIEPEFTHNLIETVVKNVAKAVLFCAAPPGADGHHHVNCQPDTYWIDLFEKAGLRHDSGLTELGRSLCPANKWRSKRNYFARSGLVFERK